MKTKSLIATTALLVFASGWASARAQDRAFTYQGQLSEGGRLATGIFDFRFAIWDQATGGNMVAGPVTNSAVGVSNGLFTTTVDFGPGVFTGESRWLEIAVRTNGSGTFTSLVSRQRLTPTPYALYVSNADVANQALGVAAGAVSNLSLAPGAVTTDKISDGTIAPADLSPAVASNSFWRLDGNAGTTAGTHFVGTTDNQPLQLRVNNQRALRLEGGPTTGNYSNIVNVVAGSEVNFAAAGAYGVTIGGGGAQNYFGAAATNSVGTGSDFATIGGGAGNRIYTDAVYATVGGGAYNSVLPGGNYASIGSGGYNAIYGMASGATIAGGYGNTIASEAHYGTIGGGLDNSVAVKAEYATIPGGRNNAATNYAFAAGRRAKANHTGAFVWADATGADFISTANNQFLVRASGGVGINTNNPQSALHVNGVVTAAGFSGPAAGLSGLNASELTSGTVPNARLSTNVSLLGQTIESSEIANGTIVNDDLSPSAAIADTKLATISTAGKVANSATTATSANTANTIVARDASGNFAAGTVTAAFSGNGGGLTNLNASQLTSGMVPAGRIGDDSIAAAKLASDAGSLAKVSAGALNLSGTNLTVSGTIASAQSSATQISPLHARVVDAGLTITPVADHYGAIVVSAASAGTYRLVVPLDLPLRVYGRKPTSWTATTHYSHASTTNYITRTRVFCSHVREAATPSVDDTDRTSFEHSWFTVTGPTHFEEEWRSKAIEYQVTLTAGGSLRIGSIIVNYTY